MLDAPPPIPPLHNTGSPGQPRDPAAHTTRSVERAAAHALQQALQLAERGYHLVPVTIRRGPDGRKRPEFHAGWKTSPTDDPDLIRDWAAQWPCSYAIACGPTGIDVIDLDPKDDGPATWARLHLPSSEHVVTTPSGGQHLYWRAGHERIGTSAGRLGTGIDVRSTGGVVFAPAAFVLDGVGEMERAGYVGELPKVADLDVLPDPVLTAYAPLRTEQRRADGAITLHDRAWIVRVLGEQRAAVAGFDPRTQGGFRTLLRGAALMFGRAAEAELWPAEELAAALARDAGEVWGGVADDDDLEWIASGMCDGPTLERWRVLERTEPGVTTLPDYVDPQVAQAPPGPGPVPTAADAVIDLHAERVRSELERLRARHDATRLFAREQRAHRPTIASGILDDLDAITPPQMLMNRLIPEQAVGFIAGRSGAYKTFLAVSWACSIATGTAWLDRDEFTVRRPCKTLYVAAEGAAGAAARIKAWEAATGRSRAGRLHLYPRPVHLNDDSAAEELGETVRDGGYQFLVIDTYHRSAPGVEENSATDFGTVFEAVARIRDDHGCGVLFVDHTGHAGDRLRGTSAKGSDADYVLTASYDGQSRAADVQRTLTVTKLKDEESGSNWPLRLDRPTGAGMPIITVGAVSIDGVALDTGGWDAKHWAAPEALGALAVSARLGSAEGVQCARDMLRVMSYVGPDITVTDAEFVTAFAKRVDGGKAWAKTSVKRGRVVLCGMDLAELAGNAAGIVLAPTMIPGPMPGPGLDRP